MVNAIAKELELRKSEVDDEVETIYFGGGTPSLLTLEEMERLIQAVYENYKVIDRPEITLEANPDDLMSSRAESRELSYFPSYEIMMDELRDYRFYGKDMVHPNELAIDYIWNRFKSVWISENAFAVVDEVDTVQKGLLHRPFNPDSEAHQKFKTSLGTKITYLQERYPFMKFE